MPFSMCLFSLMTDCSELSILPFMREMSSEAVRRGRFLKGLFAGTPLLAWNVGSLAGCFPLLALLALLCCWRLRLLWLSCLCFWF